MKKNGKKIHWIVHSSIFGRHALWELVFGGYLRYRWHSFEGGQHHHDMGTAFLTVIFQRGDRNAGRPDNVPEYSSFKLQRHPQNLATGVQNSCA